MFAGDPTGPDPLAGGGGPAAFGGGSGAGAVDGREAVLERQRQLAQEKARQRMSLSMTVGGGAADAGSLLGAPSGSLSAGGSARASFARGAPMAGSFTTGGTSLLGGPLPSGSLLSGPSGSLLSGPVAGGGGSLLSGPIAGAGGAAFGRADSAASAQTATSVTAASGGGGPFDGAVAGAAGPAGASGSAGSGGGAAFADALREKERRALALDGDVLGGRERRSMDAGLLGPSTGGAAHGTGGAAAVGGRGYGGFDPYDPYGASVGGGPAAMSPPSPGKMYAPISPLGLVPSGSAVGGGMAAAGSGFAVGGAGADGGGGGISAGAEVLDLSDLRHFLVTPVPRAAGVVQCYIDRDKSGLLSGRMFPSYSLHLKDGDIFLLAGKKRAGNRTSNYLITMDKRDLNRDSDAFLGKVRSNYFGTEFVAFDDGESPDKKTRPEDRAKLRRELAVITYAPNVLAGRGPRKMKVVVPRVGSDNKPVAFQPLK